MRAGAILAAGQERIKVLMRAVREGSAVAPRPRSPLETAGRKKKKKQAAQLELQQTDLWWKWG